MHDQPASPAAPSAPASEVYSLRDAPAVETALAQRTAEAEGGFFLPYLRPGMRLLDCGCGPGSITLGLAAAVAPGAVVGLDLQSAPVARARTAAAAGGVATAHFLVGSVYALPCPPASFDAVFAHALLLHLREPLRALREMRRVLRPGGIVGIRDPDLGTELRTPTTPLLEQRQAIVQRVYQQTGGDPFVGRQQRQLVRAAGFARVTATAAVESAGTPAATRRRAAYDRIVWQRYAQTAVAAGWLDQATVAAIAAAIDAWGADPDAFWARTYCAAVGWVGAEPRRAAAGNHVSEDLTEEVA